MRTTFYQLIFIALVLQSEDTFGGTIKGRVTEAKTNTGIVGADVFLKGTSFGAVTDTTGQYTIQEVPKGTYTIVVNVIGYADKEDRIEVLSEDVELVKNLAMKEKAITMNETVIEGRANQELESSARGTERNSGNIVNVISAQTIEQSTDRTAADVLQRVSGMSLIRSQGEGRYVVMRGLEQQYNNTLVDGIKIPSPESKDRFIPLDIFPSSLFERIEVTKSLTPELSGDAIGGSTDLILREAPQKFVFSVSAATGSTSGVLGSSFSSFDRGSVNDLDPERMHGTVNDADPTTQIKPRYNPSSSDFTTTNLDFSNKSAPPDGLLSILAGNRFFDEQLGLMAAGSYQNTFNQVETKFYSLSNNINKVDGAGHLIPYQSTYDDQNYYTNRTRVGAVVKADFIGNEEHEAAATYMLVSQQEAQTRHQSQMQVDGTRGGADLTYGHRTALRTQDISSFSLEGRDFTKSFLTFNWTLNYTDALQDRPDEAEYTVLQNYDAYGNLEPFQGLGSITHSWRRNDDRQYLGKADATIHVTSDGTQTIQAGIIVQHLKRANYEDDYKLNPSIINGSTQPFTTIDSAKVTVFGYGSTSGTSVYGYQNYKASEFLRGSYLQYTAIVGSLQILGGVRWEQANDTYFTMASPTLTGQQADVTMVDVLPGIQFRYELTSEQIMRLSVTRSMSRPSYFDLVPAVERSDESSSQGNPNLRPARSTNVDLRYEYYPDPTDVISAGAYYKKITDPIEDQFQSVGVVLSTTKGNGAPATVYGFEAVVTKHLGGFGFSANYSYVVSRISSTKQVTTIDINGDPQQSYYVETRPLQSQSPQIANIIVSYNNDIWGTGANLSYNYTGRRLFAVAYLDGYDTYQDGVGEVDFSGEQRLFPSLTLNVKLINLTNASAITEVASGNYVQHPPIVIERDLNRMRVVVGMSYKF